MIKAFQTLRSKILKEKFLLSSSALFLATLVANLTSYFYQFSMSRLMVPKDFGALNSVLSLFALVTVPAGVVGLVVTRYVSQFQAQKESGKLRLFIMNSLKNLSLFGVLLALPLWIGREGAKHFLNLESSSPMIILAAMVFTGFIFPVGISLLQGLQLFYRLGLFMIGTGLIRLLAGVLLVWLHGGVNGALSANLIACIAGFLIFYKPFKKILSDFPSQNIQRHTKEILSFSIPVTLAFLGSTCLVHLDLILVKHFLPPELAGQYAAAVILGRSIFYFPGALATTMYPMLSEASTLSKETAPILKRCLLMTLGLSGLGALLFISVPGFLIQTLFGSQYPQAHQILPFYATAMLPLALSSVFIQHELALRKFKFIYILLGMATVEGFLITLFHSSFATILTILNLSQWGLLIFLGVSILRPHLIQTVSSGLGTTS